MLYEIRRQFTFSICFSKNEMGIDGLLEISPQFNFSIYNNYINVEIKSFSSDNIILKVQDIVLVGSKDLGKYLVVAKLQ